MMFWDNPFVALIFTPQHSYTRRVRTKSKTSERSFNLNSRGEIKRTRDRKTLVKGSLVTYKMHLQKIEIAFAHGPREREKKRVLLNKALSESESALESACSSAALLYEDAAAESEPG